MMNRNVVIAGMGCSEAGVRSDTGQEDLIVEAGLAAIESAGLVTGDVEASWFGCTTVSANHALLNFSLKLGYKAMTKVQNGGATGADALRGAYFAIASGLYDVTLAAGVEKPTDSGFVRYGEGAAMGGSSVGADSVAGEFSAPSNASMYLNRYSSVYGVAPDRMRSALTRLATRSRRAGSHNSLAAFQTPISEDDLRSAPRASGALTVLDCAESLDGAAAAIVCTEEVALRQGRPYIVLEGIGVASGGMEGRLDQRYEYLGLPEAREAARKAYAMAQIVDPEQEIDHASVFDMTTGSELLAYEDLGLAEKGRAVDVVLDGAFDIEGRIPTNTDGGMLSNGFQAGATGIRQVYESFLQLTGAAGDHQLPSVSKSLVYSVGGGIGSVSAFVQIFGKPD